MNLQNWFGNYCSICNNEKIDFDWCRECNAKHFQQNFKNWTSGNDGIDKFIQHTQLSANKCLEVLEWIPYERFYDVEYVAKGGFGKVYKAKWIDGSIHKWDDKEQNWERLRADGFVALKHLNDSENVSSEFMDEVTCHRELDSNAIIKLYGITQDPETKNYTMVLEYAEQGSLRRYLDKNNLIWGDKINYLLNIALGLDVIHEKGLIHRDLHMGNILMNNNTTCITDMGLCRPASSDNTSEVYGVTSYMAPEILRGNGGNYTKAADIYGFGIIMYEIISTLPPYHDIPHDETLIIEICKERRPKFNFEVPQLIFDLIKNCWDANPSNRPTTNIIKLHLNRWYQEIDDYKNNSANQSELIKQIIKAEKFNKNNFPTNGESGEPSSTLSTLSTLSNKIHSEAVYTSRRIICNNLPEPKSSEVDSLEYLRI